MRTKKGTITSAKMTGTVTVTVQRYAVHPKYKKRFRISKKYLVDPNGHDPLHEGDQVVIGECSPRSKKKYFKIVDVTKRMAEVSDLQEEEGLDSALHREKPQEEEAQKETAEPDATETTDTSSTTAS